MKKYCALFLLLILTFLLVGCGGGTSGGFTVSIDAPNRVVTDFSHILKVDISSMTEMFPDYDTYSYQWIITSGNINISTKRETSGGHL